MGHEQETLTKLQAGSTYRHSKTAIEERWLLPQCESNTPLELKQTFDVSSPSLAWPRMAQRDRSSPSEFSMSGTFSMSVAQEQSWRR
jgi:hypothetical protein